MARLMVFLGIVVLGVGAALFLVSERSAITGAGYRVARLDGECRRLVEANRKLDAQIAVAKTPGAIAESVKTLNLPLVSPHELLDLQLAKEKEQEKAKADAERAAARSRRTR